MRFKQSFYAFGLLTILALTVSVKIVIRRQSASWGAHRNTRMIYRPALLDFSVFSNTDHVVSVEIVAKNRTIQHAYRESERYYKDLPTWLDRYSFLPTPNEVPNDQRVCLVHVGK